MNINKETYKKICEICKLIRATNSSTLFRFKTNLLVDALVEVEDEVTDSPEELNVKQNTMLALSRALPYVSNLSYNVASRKETTNDFIIGRNPEYWASWATHRKNRYSKSVEDSYIREHTRKVVYSCTQSVVRLLKEASNKNIIMNNSYLTVFPKMPFINEVSRHFDTDFLTNAFMLKESGGEVYVSDFYNEFRGSNFYETVNALSKILFAVDKPVSSLGKVSMFSVDPLALLYTIAFMRCPKFFSLNQDIETITNKLVYVVRVVTGQTCIASVSSLLVFCSQNCLVNRILSVNYSTRNNRRFYPTDFGTGMPRRQIYKGLTNKDFFPFEDVYEPRTEEEIINYKTHFEVEVN